MELYFFSCLIQHTLEHVCKFKRFFLLFFSFQLREEFAVLHCNSHTIKMAASSYNYVLVVGCICFMLPIGSIAWQAHFEPNPITIQMNKVQTINLTLSNLDNIELIQNNAELIVFSDEKILHVITPKLNFDNIPNDTWTGQFNISGEFLGLAKIYANISVNGKSQRSNETLHVVIIREERLIDRIFTISVIVLVSILYINFGAALDLGKVKEILVRPIGPLIAFVCQFLFMPLVNYFFFGPVHDSK